MGVEQALRMRARRKCRLPLGEEEKNILLLGFGQGLGFGLGFLGSIVSSKKQGKVRNGRESSEALGRLNRRGAA
jgi:hypothetical protein